jgi:hypothetical protein
MMKTPSSPALGTRSDPRSARLFRDLARAQLSSLPHKDGRPIWHGEAGIRMWSRLAIAVLVVVALGVGVFLATSVLENDEQVPAPTPIQLPASGG